MTQQTESSYFSELKQIAKFTRTPGSQAEGRDRLVRFLDSYPGVEGVDPIVDSLCVHFGLFPYVSPSRNELSAREALAYEFRRPGVSPYGDEIVFHEEQSDIFHRLLDGESVALSAPTSFGKSVLLDGLIATGKWNNVVVIVPTIALIDEVRRRLMKFRGSYNIIIHPSQEPQTRNIYVLTQERFLEFQQVPDVDLFMIDEFYKLSSHEADDQRMSLLNIAWRRLRDTGAQFYLTGPNVGAFSSELDQEFRDALHVSDFRTVATDIVDRSDTEDDARLEDMRTYWPSLEGSTLVFVSAPQRAERVSESIAQFSTGAHPHPFVHQILQWLKSHYHPSWRVVHALEGGVGTHTGPLPRSLQRMMVRLFNQGQLQALVCTTTLIEGVNTSAKNVVIYDKKISKRPIDSFTFNNVRGRAGRMDKHFIGKVITYMKPPVDHSLEVDIPIDSQPDDAPLASLVQLPEDQLNEGSRLRLREVWQQADLSLSTIRLNRGVDPKVQIEAARELRKDPERRRKMSWSGQPAAADAYATLEFSFSHFLTPRQRSGMSVNKLWKTMQSVQETRGNLSELVDRQKDFKFANEDLSDVVSNVLFFQRNWMGFHIPAMLKVAQRIYNDVARDFSEPVANYEYYLSQVEGLFLPPGVLDLDDYGLPLPVTLRFLGFGMRMGGSLNEALDSFIILARDSTIRNQLSEVELWFTDDVLAGLGAGL